MKKGNILNNCLVSEWGGLLNTKQWLSFFTYKWKFCSGIHYKLAICIRLLLLMDFMNQECGMISAYLGMLPYQCWRKAKMWKQLIHTEVNHLNMSSVSIHWSGTRINRQDAKLCHETASKRLKQWQCSKQLHQGDFAHHHWRYFRAVAVITEVCIENGEPLLNVKCKDPDMDNFYFEVDENDLAKNLWVDLYSVST